MIQAKHCNLCVNPKRDLKNGLTCGLTDKKPTFKNNCPDIEFNKSFKDYLPELMNQIEQLKKIETSIYLKFIFYGAIGLTIMIGSGLNFMKTYKIDFYYSDLLKFNTSFLFFIVGIFLVSIGFRILNKYKKELAKLKSEKKEIELILDNYKIDIETIINGIKK